MIQYISQQSLKTANIIASYISINRQVCQTCVGHHIGSLQSGSQGIVRGY